MNIDTRVAIYDNGGDTADRYTAVFLQPNTNGRAFWYDFLAMDENPSHPLGFGQHGEFGHEEYDPDDDELNNHIGVRIKFAELPEACQRAVLNDLQGED